MPRVLRILNRLIIGGPSLNASYLTRYMAPDFETMMVIGEKDLTEQNADFITDRLGIEPVIVPEMRRSINPFNDRQAYLKIKQLIKQFKPDIVHTHAAKSGTIGRLAASACNVPVVVHTFHGHVFHSYFSKLETTTYINIERYLARKSSGIIAISELQKKELGEIYKICPPEKINIIPLGLDLDKFRENKEEKRAAFRREFQIDEDEIAVGIIGRIVPIKNHTLFVQMAAEIRKRTDKKVKFVIVGDGDMRPQLETDFAAVGIDYCYYPEAHLKTTAICTSWQMEIDRALAGMDIVVLTSNNEGTPVSLIEAQAAGRPVVTTNAGGVADTIVKDRSGFITDIGNAAQMAEAVLKLINSAELRAQLGNTGANFTAQRFSYQRLVADTSNYYYQLLEEKNVLARAGRLSF